MEEKPIKLREILGGESREVLRKGVSDYSELREGYKPGKPEGVARPSTYPIPPAIPNSPGEAGGEKK
jgi:hypothetical protein